LNNISKYFSRNVIIHYSTPVTRTFIFCICKWCIFI